MCIKNGKYKECIICGCEFYITPAQESRGRYLCCSKECGYKYRSTLVNTKKGKTYKHLQRAVTRKCKTCGIEFKAINDHNGKLGGKNTRTPQIYCSHNCYVKGNRISGFECNVYEYLNQFNGNITQQIKKGRWSFDMGITNTNILIEADGSYWHSFEKAKERDERKKEWCNKNGFELFRIDELEFYKNKDMACQVIVDRMRKLEPTIKIKRNGEDYVKAI